MDPDVAAILAATDYIDLTFRNPAETALVNFFSAWYESQTEGAGAVFGLTGAHVVLDSTERRGAERRGRALGLVLALVATNVALWVVVSGNLAWVAHPGGFARGAALALAGPRADRFGRVHPSQKRISR